jgi:hypothetical protein
VKERVPRQTWTSAYSAYNEALKAYNEAFDIASADTLKATLDDFLVLYLKPTITEDLWNRVKVVFDFYRKQANVLDQMIETTMLAEQAKQRKEKEEAMAKKLRAQHILKADVITFLSAAPSATLKNVMPRLLQKIEEEGDCEVERALRRARDKRHEVEQQQKEAKRETNVHCTTWHDAAERLELSGAMDAFGYNETFQFWGRSNAYWLDNSIVNVESDAKRRKVDGGEEDGAAQQRDSQ